MVWIAASFVLRLAVFFISLIMSPFVWVALLVTVFHWRHFHPDFFSHSFKSPSSCSRKGNSCGNDCRRDQQHVPPFHPPPPPHFNPVAAFFVAHHDSVNQGNETGSPISSTESSQDQTSEQNSKSEQDSTITSINPKHCIDEDDTSFILSIDVPGFQKEDLKITIGESDSTILVLGKRSVNNQRNKTIEFSKKPTFDPTKIHLSDNDDVSDSIVADLSLGVLTIELPKKAEEPPRLIPILTNPVIKHEDKSSE